VTILTMSNNECDRFEIISQVDDKKITRAHAAQMLGLSVRQIHRLVTRYRADGISGLISKQRGKPSNRRYPDSFRDYLLHIVRSEYSDFGPTFACEKLREQHNLHVSVTTLRHWMVADGIWTTRRELKKRVYQPRYRRECYGELIQIDGSDHHWFEDRAPRCTLLVYIDDATGKLMELRFAASESTFDYFQETHGKPVAFYSDKHSVFRVNKAGATTGSGMTQFGRALHELNIDIICANTSQAKGRVERVNRTLQDRLVKEMRLKGISNIESGNAYLPIFMEDFNQRFGKEPFNSKDVHRPLGQHDTLDSIMTWQVERTVTNSLTVQYDRVVYLLEPNGSVMTAYPCPTLFLIKYVKLSKLRLFQTNDWVLLYNLHRKNKPNLLRFNAVKKHLKEKDKNNWLKRNTLTLLLFNSDISKKRN